MYHLFVGPLLLLATLFTTTDAPVPMLTEAAALVEQLGSPDFAEREDATKRLEELGATAIEALRVGAKSMNAETALRAQELLRKAERRLAHEKTLAPTLVTLDAKEQPLKAVLADLSKQTKYELVLGGLKTEQLASKRVSVSTDGEVPFWKAVLQVCDAAEVEIASVSGFLAPGATPQAWSSRPEFIVLEARGSNPRRPAAIRGAVLVEAVPFPANTTPSNQASALLQIWPEPRLAWAATITTKVATALDAEGNRLATHFLLPTPLKSPNMNRGDQLVVIRNADGTASFVRGPADAGAGGLGVFRPNLRQAVVQFEANAKEPAPREVKELAVSLFATVRSGIDPLCQVNGLEQNKPASAKGIGGTELSVSYGVNEQKRLEAVVRLTYDQKAVRPATVGDKLTGLANGGATGNQTVYGVRVTDSNGKAYTLGLISGSNQFDSAGMRTNLTIRLELHSGRDGFGPPAAVTFWGSCSKPVEIPITLRDVPLVGRKK